MASYSVGMSAPASRVNLAEWVRRLGERDLDAVLRHEYVNYLRILVRNGVLHGPFRRPPPPAALLAPLGETLCNDMCDKIPELPRAGAMQPYLMHRTADGAAYLAAKSIPGKGVFCYVAVNPNPT